jgi:hypothetical protein
LHRWIPPVFFLVERIADDEPDLIQIGECGEISPYDVDQRVQAGTLCGCAARGA